MYTNAQRIGLRKYLKTKYGSRKFNLAKKYVSMHLNLEKWSEGNHWRDNNSRWSWKNAPGFIFTPMVWEFSILLLLTSDNSILAEALISPNNFQRFLVETGRKEFNSSCIDV